MILCIYENREEALNLEPLSLTRPSFLLRCGSFSFLERIRNLLPGTRVALFVRDELASVTRERYGNLDINPESVTDALWLNGCVLWRKEDVDRMVEEVDTLFYRGDRLIGAHLTRQDGEQWLREGGPVRGVPDNSLSRVEIPVPVIRYLWDCVDMNGEAISGDSDSFHLGVQEGTVDGGAHLLNSSSIHVGEGSRVKQGAVLDAENGPILVGRDVTILPNA
ncbi:MAG: putative sugar nucleotidyl transferase, partial [Fidelibacterota bacterium]